MSWMEVTVRELIPARETEVAVKSVYPPRGMPEVALRTEIRIAVTLGSTLSTLSYCQIVQISGRATGVDATKSVATDPGANRPEKICPYGLRPRDLFRLVH